MTVRSFSKDTLVGDNQIIKHDRVLLTNNGNVKKKLCVFLYILGYDILYVVHVSVVNEKNGKIMINSFRVVLYGSYFVGTGIEGGQRMDNVLQRLATYISWNFNLFLEK